MNRGVGFTGSVIDLLTLYRACPQSAKEIELINPDPKTGDLAKQYFVTNNVRQYKSVDEWISAIN